MTRDRFRMENAAVKVVHNMHRPRRVSLWRRIKRFLRIGG